MPAIRTMFWNIETFGDQMKTRGNYAAMCNFVARVAFNQGADILAIMELRSAGVPHLYTLAQALNNAYGPAGDWYYDWIRGAVRTDIGGAPVNDANDLAMDVDHHEGYAVFWNDAQHPNFTMLGTSNAYSAGSLRPVPAGGIGAPPPARIPANVLGLVLEGRAQGALVNNWFNAPPFAPVAGAAWGNLNFSQSNPINVGDVKRGGPRRPCYFVIEVQGRAAPNNTLEHRFVPMLVYHATSNARSRRLNTQLSGYSRQLYSVNTNPAGPPIWVTAQNAVIAGDFNVDANKRNEGEAGGVAYDAYTVFTHAFVNGGAGCWAGAGNPRGWLDLDSMAGGNANTPRTTVQLKTGYGANEVPIPDNAPINDFIKLAIDNIFYRLGAGVATVPPGPMAAYQAVYNLVQEVINGNLRNAVAPNLVSDFWQVIFAQLGGANAFGPYPNYPNTAQTSLMPTRTVDQNEEPFMSDVLRFGRLRRGLRAGHFQNVNGVPNDGSRDARVAAEFIHHFISDHLPVTMQLNFA